MPLLYPLDKKRFSAASDPGQEKKRQCFKSKSLTVIHAAQIYFHCTSQKQKKQKQCKTAEDFQTRKK